MPKNTEAEVSGARVIARQEAVGSWVAAEVRHGWDQVIRNGNGDPICSLLLAGWDKASQKKHARLIASAPELLAALERCIEIIEFAYMDAPKPPKEVVQARAAIAKARGDA